MSQPSDVVAVLPSGSVNSARPTRPGEPLPMPSVPSLEAFIASPAFDDLVLEALREGAREAEEERRMRLPATPGT